MALEPIQRLEVKAARLERQVAEQQKKIERLEQLVQELRTEMSIVKSRSRITRINIGTLDIRSRKLIKVAEILWEAIGGHSPRDKRPED